MADLERSTAAAPATVTAAQVGELEALPALVGRLGDDVMKLLDTKLSLLKVEMKEDADAYISGGVMIGIGGVIAAIGFALVNVAVALGVATLLPEDWNPSARYAVGFVITGIVYLIVGGIIVVVMKNRLAKYNPVPSRSVDELRKDKQWLKKEI
ncbi:MAG: phage holin family protein [Pyrinomonadaceae bacterium]